MLFKTFDMNMITIVLVKLYPGHTKSWSLHSLGVCLGLGVTVFFYTGHPTIRIIVSIGCPNLRQGTNPLSSLLSTSPFVSSKCQVNQMWVIVIWWPLDYLSSHFNPEWDVYFLELGSFWSYVFPAFCHLVVRPQMYLLRSIFVSQFQR